MTPSVNARAKTDHNLYLSQIKAILDQVFSARYREAKFECEIYLFGSRATNRYHDASDFDIGILASRDISRELSIAGERLEESSIPFTVDLVDLSATSEEFARRVQREGTLLWKS